MAKKTRKFKVSYTACVSMGIVPIQPMMLVAIQAEEAVRRDRDESANPRRKP